MCQLVGWQLALQTQFSDGFKKSHWFSVCLAFACHKNTCDSFSTFPMLEGKLEVVTVICVTSVTPALTIRFQGGEVETTNLYFSMVTLALYILCPKEKNVRF